MFCVLLFIIHLVGVVLINVYVCDVYLRGVAQVTGGARSNFSHLLLTAVTESYG